MKTVPFPSGCEPPEPCPACGADPVLVSDFSERDSGCRTAYVRCSKNKAHLAVDSVDSCAAGQNEATAAEWWNDAADEYLSRSNGRRTKPLPR